MLKNRNSSVGETPCSATALRKASRRLTQLYDAALDGCGLRSTQLTILVELAGRTGQPPTMAELAIALVMDRSGDPRPPRFAPPYFASRAMRGWQR